MTSFEAGELFAGRYKIVRRLGAGGMGAVYLACDPLEEEFLVALKVLNPGQAQNTVAKERFRNEITASYKINHPNVVRAYEYFDAEDVQAYAMEFVDGGDLMERMNAGTPSTHESLTILIQSADALTAIHSAGIIHRDFKPENILLTKNGLVKITDFGVARLKDARTLTSAGSMVGTPKFLAPEYIEIGECDARGDIFALGVIAYELLSGEAPFGNESNPSKMLERLRIPATQLSERVPRLPVGLAAVVMKAMDTRVASRYQTALDFLNDLKAVKSGGVPLALTEAAAAPKQNGEASAGFIDGFIDRFDSSVDSIGAGSQTDRTERSRAFSLPPVTPADLALSPGKRSIEEELRAVTSLEELQLAATRERAPMWPKACAVALLTGLVVAIGVSYQVFAPALTNMPEGGYTGTAFGLFGEGSQTPLGLIRSESNTVVILGRSGCAPAKLEKKSSTFKCGDLTFDFTVQALTEASAVGTIRERSWDTSGTWSIGKR